MNKDGFVIGYDGHERAARKLLLQEKMKTIDELAIMSAREIEQTINAGFEAIECGDDWLLVPREKFDEFKEIITWITR